MKKMETWTNLTITRGLEAIYLDLQKIQTHDP